MSPHPPERLTPELLPLRESLSPWVFVASPSWPRCSRVTKLRLCPLPPACVCAPGDARSPPFLGGLNSSPCWGSRNKSFREGPSCKDPRGRGRRRHKGAQQGQGQQAGLAPVAVPAGWPASLRGEQYVPFSSPAAYTPRASSWPQQTWAPTADGCPCQPDFGSHHYGAGLLLSTAHSPPLAPAR